MLTWLAHPVAAIDVVGLGDDVVAFGRGQEYGHASEVFCGAHSPVRHILTDQTFLFPQRAFFVPGEEGVDAAPVLTINDPGRWR